jgi:outer membrane lipoprotein-sorting protein
MKKIILTAFILSSSLFAISNLEVAKKADKIIEGFQSSIAQTKMILINAAGQKSIRDLYMLTLEGEKGDKTLSTFLNPADIKGTKTLTHQHLNKDDDQWLYLPALKRIKRIASRNKSGSFMGSEFSYEDIGNQNYQKFIFSDEAKEVILDGQECYESTRIPKNKNSGYTKQITWIDKKEFLIRKIDYYDRKKELLKTAIFSKYKKINTIWRVGQIEMKNFQNDKSTILMWEKEKLHAGLKDKDFNKRVLKK